MRIKVYITDLKIVFKDCLSMILYQFGKCNQVDAIRISAGSPFLQYTLNIFINNLSDKVEGILIKSVTSGTT